MHHDKAVFMKCFMFDEHIRFLLWIKLKDLFWFDRGFDLGTVYFSVLILLIHIFK